MITVETAVVRPGDGVRVSISDVVESHCAWPRVLVELFEVIIRERGTLLAVLID
jgi:hypothetical protein